jgi:hypothetical protein
MEQIAGSRAAAAQRQQRLQQRGIGGHKTPTAAGDGGHPHSKPPGAWQLLHHASPPPACIIGRQCLPGAAALSPCDS